MTGIQICPIYLVDLFDCGAVLYCYNVAQGNALFLLMCFIILGLDFFYAILSFDGHLALLELHGRRCYYRFCFQVDLSFGSRSAHTSWVWLGTLRLLLIGIFRSFCLWSFLWYIFLGCSLIVIQSFGLFCCGGCASLATRRSLVLLFTYVDITI